MQICCKFDILPEAPRALLDRAREYYKKNRYLIKEKRSNLPDEKKKKIKQYQKRYRDNRCEENIIKKREYARNWYQNLPEDKKKRK